jgi:AbrB family looped-hinge helix DNA binding protein
MVVVKVTRNSQVTIPKEIRKKVSIKEGDKVEVTVEGERVIIRKLELGDITDFLPKDFDEITAKLRKDSKDRLRRLGVIK